MIAVVLLAGLAAVGAIVMIAHRRARPLRLSLSCPHCGVGQVETAVKVGFIRGFLFVCRYGSSVEIGCTACVRRRVGSAAVRTLVLGWWCWPWGIATPLVVLQNLLQLLVPPPGQLQTALARAGVPLDEVLLDDDSLTGRQRQFLSSVCACAARLELAGSRDAIRSAAVALVIELSDGALTESRARELIDGSRSAPLAAPSDEFDRRLAVLQAAVAIASFTGAPSASILATLELITAELGLPAPVLARMLGLDEPSDDASATAAPHPEIERAAAILGVSVDAPLATARERWRALLLQWHPDHAAASGVPIDEATRRTREINDAYKVLVDAAHATVG